MSGKVSCYADFEGKHKAQAIMRAFAEGCGGQMIIVREPVPDWNAPDHAVYGMWRVQMELVRKFRRDGRPFWYIDNGWFRNIGEREIERRWYRVTRNGMAPRLLPGRTMDRAGMFHVKIQPWRTGGRHVLVCLPYNQEFAKGFGVDYSQWLTGLQRLLPTITDRPIKWREKPRDVTKIQPLAVALQDAWCLVTHSSNAAVEAALMGVPVFCEPTCGAAMVGCADFTKIEDPVRPDNREEWIASLMWQQFSLAEFRSGLAWETLADGWKNAA